MKTICPQCRAPDGHHKMDCSDPTAKLDRKNALLQNQIKEAMLRSWPLCTVTVIRAKPGTLFEGMILVEAETPKNKQFRINYSAVVLFQVDRKSDERWFYRRRMGGNDTDLKRFRSFVKDHSIILDPVVIAGLLML